MFEEIIYIAGAASCARCLRYIDSQKFQKDQRYSICTDCDASTCRERKASKDKNSSGCPRDLDHEKLMELGTTMNVEAM
jgi:hypothetical protein